MKSIIDYLEHWTALQPNTRFTTFLDDTGSETDAYTYLSFNKRTRFVAERLSRDHGMKAGDRAILAYPPGLEIIVALFACARLGVIPVPVYPPTQMNLRNGLTKLAFVARDCDARFVLTTHALHRVCRLHLDGGQTTASPADIPPLPPMQWTGTDQMIGESSEDLPHDRASILFLQYTSGSTGDPKGVILSHQQVIHNARATIDHQPTGVSWLPQYHDMGLIGYYLYPVITGGATYGFSPLTFLKRPMLWLETIGKVRATYASSPNFGFEYCLRDDKVPPSELARLDLSSVRVMMNASEPVRADTYRRFLAKFAPCGLRPEAHVVAYGLAENTLAVTHYGRRIMHIDKRMLQHGIAQRERVQPVRADQLHLVSCGRPLKGVHVRIVAPESHAGVPDGRVGEIWVAGASACKAYWQRPAMSREVFGKQVTNDADDHNLYLRTGDLGFLDEGELFVCGRLKDLIIIRGVNYYPQDIEAIVRSVSAKVRTAVAFRGDGEEETLVVLVEVDKTDELPDPAELARAVAARYDILPHTVVFVPARTVGTTSSGKLARSATRQRWLDGDLPAIATHVIGAAHSPGTRRTVSRERLREFLAEHELSGYEDSTFSELGVDSLSMVMLLEEIEQLLGEHGAAELAEDAGIPVLQRLTIDEFFSLVDKFDQASSEGIAALHDFLKRIKLEQEAHERERIRADTRLGPIDRSVFGRTDEGTLTDVLLTGVTGFFGPFLLSALLRHTTFTYHVLTRCADAAHGMRRISAALRSAKLWTPELEAQIEKRVRVVCGDLARNNIGLREVEWNTLATSVQAVFHNAALVNYVLDYDALRLHNVVGTRELLRFASSGRRKQFHLVSSTIIFGWTQKSPLLETDNNDAMENLDFGYAQSKWAAEQLVFAAYEQGLVVKVYRPSFITATSDGVASREDIVIRLLAFMINHGVAVNSRNQLSFLPADALANSMALIFMHGRATDQTFHMTVDYYYCMMDVTRLITQEYGYQFDYYDIPEFVAQMKLRCSRADLLYPLVDFFKRAHPRIAAMQHKRYCNERYREARGRGGVGCEEPSFRDTIMSLIEYMRSEGLITRAAPSRQRDIAGTA
jgi:thioester reductase-like protein